MHKFTFKRTLIVCLVLSKLSSIFALSYLHPSTVTTSKTLKFFATTVEGMEKVLMLELKHKYIDANNVVQGKCGVYFKGNIQTALSAVMWSRTAIRIMEQVTEGTEINSKNDLYDLVSSVDWTNYLCADDTLKVDTTLGQATPDLSHSHFNSLTVKNAIVDQFRGLTGKRPSVDTEDPYLPLLLYMHRGKATLYRIWSGDQSMHKRGYRQLVHKAALRETTAAALLNVAEWDPGSDLLCDPMCGSGTIAIEAALMATNTAPGLLRFGHSEDNALAPPRSVYWPGVEEGLWDEVWEQADTCDRRKELSQMRGPPLILANDHHKGAVELAICAAADAGVHRLIDFSCRDVEDYRPKLRPDVVVTNPPWDRRLDGADVAWTKLGHFSRAIMPGKSVWTLSGNDAVMQRIDLAQNRSFRFNAASVDLTFAKYCVEDEVME